MKNLEKAPITKECIRPFFFIVFVGIFLFLVQVSSIQAATSNDALRIITPQNNSWVTEGSLFLVGELSDDSVSEVKINGVKVEAKGNAIPVKGGAFGAMIKFSKGLNTIKVQAGKKTATIKVYFEPLKTNKKPKTPAGFKRFYTHANPSQLNCKECHRFKRGKYNFKRIVPARANCTTGNCHQNFGKAKHVHGPIGAGICISCHSPHGSFQRFELQRTKGDLCLVCHQARQEEFTQAVVHKPVKEGCVNCHDPHESNMRFQLRGDGKSASSLCFNCHENKDFSREHRHGPVGAGDCIACHRPHSSAYPRLLIAKLQRGEVCFQCHKERQNEFTMKQVHAPVEDNCNKCHEPHSSDTRFQLIKPGGQLCATCHIKLSPKVYNEIKTAKFKHRPVDEGKCEECHRVHSSNYKPLLKNSLEKLCLTCHTDLGDEIIESKFKHGPVQTGDCTACHKTHGSPFTQLLSRFYPVNFYSEYKPEYYDLCFGCHNKDIAKKKFTTTLTNFRDGNYNLHHFHVNMKKGRTCTACHDAHASSQAKHVRYEVPFGSWSYPIELTKTSVGGTCVVGCHAPKTYDRNNPKIKPAR